MIPFSRPLESDSSSNFHAVDFVWMNPSLPQRSCSAGRRSWSGDFFLHDWHSLYHSDTSCVISTESDQHFLTRFSLSASNWVAAKLLYNLGRIHRTPRGSLRVGSSSGDNAHRFQKEKWSVLICQNKKWFWRENTSRILHEVSKWSVFWSFELKKRP